MRPVLFGVKRKRLFKIKNYNHDEAGSLQIRLTNAYPYLVNGIFARISFAGFDQQEREQIIRRAQLLIRSLKRMFNLFLANDIIHSVIDSVIHTCLNTIQIDLPENFLEYNDDFPSFIVGLYSKISFNELYDILLRVMREQPYYFVYATNEHGVIRDSLGFWKVIRESEIMEDVGDLFIAQQSTQDQIINNKLQQHSFAFRLAEDLNRFSYDNIRVEIVYDETDIRLSFGYLDERIVIKMIDGYDNDIQRLQYMVNFTDMNLTGPNIPVLYGQLRIIIDDFIYFHH